VSAPGPRLPAGASRYGWFVAVVGLLLVAYVSLNTLRTDSVGSQGLKLGAKVPPFAAPLALGTIDGDVNVARKPNQGSAGARPACSVRGPQILNSCQLAERGPFVLAFLATRGTQCTRELDRLGRRAGHERRRARRSRARPALRHARAGGTGEGLAAVTDADPALEEGWVDRELALEFPELRIVSATAPAPGRRTPSAQRERLALLADRFHGARALTLRREPVPAAYRAFFRHVGLDPDAQRTPVEAAALDRLIQGGFVSRGPLEDALLVAVIETGVPVWAVDDARLDGPLGLRGAHAGERLGEGEYAADLAPGRVVVADAAGPVAVLFGDVAPSRRPHRDSARLRLFAVAAPGVPALHVEEALFGCAEALSDARGAQ
jgi:DNA/RNA-binding domain of Phe-tRNA-synthetase-like protein